MMDTWLRQLLDCTYTLMCVSMSHPNPLLLIPHRSCRAALVSTTAARLGPLLVFTIASSAAVRVACLGSFGRCRQPGRIPDVWVSIESDGEPSRAVDVCTWGGAGVASGGPTDERGAHGHGAGKVGVRAQTRQELSPGQRSLALSFPQFASQPRSFAPTWITLCRPSTNSPRGSFAS